jgi:uncharacterized protein YcnI/copper(I)-binding protein
MSSIRSRPLPTAALLLFALYPFSQAQAHVSLERGEAARGATYKAVIKLPHGCEGSPTQAVRVAIPEGFIGVKPMPKPGWKLDTVRGPYAQTYGYFHGETLSEGVKEILWSDGNLPDDYYDEFVAAGFIAKELKPGARLYFKVTQTCAKGEVKWDQVAAEGADPHSLETPAAILKIASDDDDASADTPDGATIIGTLVVEDAWARATPNGAKVGAGYFAIRNTGSTPDTLISVETPAAKRAEIHDMTMTDGIMRMRRLADGLEIPAGGRVELKPSGMHLMLLDLTGDLVEGQSTTLKLNFKSGASGQITMPVKGLGAGGSGDHDHQH